jgi:phospholipase/carboxylesterase
MARVMREAKVTRRCFAMGIAAASMPGCVSRALMEAGEASTQHVRARPGSGASTVEPGTHALNLRAQRDTLLYVPKSARLDQPAPLMVYLHGATGSEEQGIRRLGPLADEMGFVVLSPASQGGTWDAIRDEYGPDVKLIDRALERTFAICRVDPKRIGLSGFSDGASYGLGLGLANGDLFGAVAAFSPGFFPPRTARSGKPRIFVSHGRQDTILPIERCSRLMVPELTKAGYAVTFREFEGPHTVPKEIAEESMRWFLG